VGLTEYRKKRRFDRTPEPRGKRAGTGRALRFVVQKHAATRLHYDFRLELDGVLKSWAVPKGPSLNPADRRLAVQVEDHPLDYRTFEGTIPAGNYGAGEVIVWDEGTYRAAGRDGGDAGERELRRGLEAGRLDVALSGRKLNGEFTLVRTSRKGEEDGKNWLLIKRRDEWTSDEDVTADGRSVLSGRSLNGANGAPSQKGKRTRSKPTKTSATGPMPANVRPMLATLVDEPFDRAGWLFEIKWDGYRAVAEVTRRGVKLYSRNHTSFNTAFAPVVESLKRLGREAVLDGEVVVLDHAGRSRFQLLQNYRRTGEGRLVYCVFDLLYLDGRDLRGDPLRVRRQLLSSVLTGLPNVTVSEAVPARGIDFFRAAAEHGLEGIIAKDGESPYREGRRGTAWLKVKTHDRQEAVIGGFTEPRRSRRHLGAVVLGVYDGPDLVYIGHTGGGSDERQLADLRERLDPLVRKACPFKTRPKVNAPVRWVEPRLVCEVRFQEWTADGRMRQPILLGLREDKPARSVRRETPKHVAPAAPAGRSRKGRAAARPEAEGAPALSNLDKVYWPDDGTTKGDVIDYYREIAPAILPYLRDRPLSLHRHPDGIAGPSFFQKDVSGRPPPAWVETVPVRSESTGKMGRYVVCNDAPTLLYLANLGCIEMNPWNARVGSPDRPDYLVIDLDPVGVRFEQVIEAAVAVRKHLERAGAESVCKTSGQRGLHVFVPLGARYTTDEARRFAELVAQLVHADLRGTTSLVRSPRKRQRRVYLDYLQNRRGQTVAAAYSVRPHPGATVSTPLLWREVKKGLDPAAFTIRTLARRLDRVHDLWRPVLGPGVDLGGSLDRLANLVAGAGPRSRAR
jgi:bifunctional non-homologous end joining protein LigD